VSFRVASKTSWGRAYLSDAASGCAATLLVVSVVPSVVVLSSLSALANYGLGTPRSTIPEVTHSFTNGVV
jgi:hypothetical protein